MFRTSFDIDGRKDLRSAASFFAMQLYNLPQNAVVRPLNTEGIAPIFVVGCGHSGTSLLASILGRSDKLLMVGYESGVFFPKKSLMTAKEVVRSWVNLARQFGLSGFVEKTPKHLHCIDRILKVVPNARIVVITRDGRDVMASFMSRGMSPEFAVERWCQDNQKVLALDGHASIIKTRYEDIVADPTAELQRLCDALGLEFSDEMITGTGSGYGWIKDGNMAKRAAETSKPIYDSRGKWKQALTSEHLEIFWKEASGIMSAFGYEK
ncbi:sulfotransferase family protein [Actibacterium lipolyticum]|nr:sulfotransferase [Actibacterium lipolyticum]